MRVTGTRTAGFITDTEGRDDAADREGQFKISDPGRDRDQSRALLLPRLGFLLLLATSGAAWASSAQAISAQAAPSDSAAPATPPDTVGMEQAVPVMPAGETKQIEPGPQTASPDSVRAPAVLLPIPADSSAAGDTLQFIAPVPSGGVPAAPPGTSPPPPKQRTGILGIHPIAILLGLVLLHVFVINLVGG